MRKVILFLLLAFSSQITFSQKVIAALKEDFDEYNIEIQEKNHVSAFGDSTAAYKDDASVEVWINQWQKLLQDFGSFTKKNDFWFEKQTKVFVRFYFNSEGGIDCLLYNFVDTEVEPTKSMPSGKEQVKFEELLNNFVKKYKIDNPSNKPIKQCGSIGFNPKEV